MARLRGKIKTWKENGFGFIESPGQRDVFVHFTAITNCSRSSLDEGTEVEFEIVPGIKPDTVQAAKVIVLDPALATSEV